MNPSVQMAGMTQRHTVSIAAGFHVARHGLAGAQLRMRCGRAWLTQHGDIRDYFVSAGDAVRIDLDGPVVIQALSDTEIEIERSAPPAPMPRSALIGRRYWAATAALLALALAGVSGALVAVLALTVVQAAHMLRIHGRLAAPAVQTRVAYFVLLAAGLWPPLALVHWLQLAGTAAAVTVDYCPMARALSLAPWNRRGAPSLADIAAAFFTPPRAWRFTASDPDASLR
jgi:hypothetical protein